MTEPPNVGYRQIADDLRRKITSGELPAGHQLPSRRELMNSYGVAFATAGKVFDLLRAEGLVSVQPKRGYFVRSQLRILRSSPGRVSRSVWGEGKAIQDQDAPSQARTVTVEIKQLEAPVFATEGLGIAAGSKALARIRLFVVEDRPVQLAVSYLPIDLAEGTPLAQVDTGDGGIYARLADLGHGPTHFTERIRKCSLTDDEAHDLSMPHGSWVYEVIRYAHSDQRCVEVNRMLLDPDVYELEYNFPS